MFQKRYDDEDDERCNVGTLRSRDDRIVLTMMKTVN
jgi:hypothetical protein